MTSSDGICGLIWFGRPPKRVTASRIAAKSTTQGTPVKSCNTTRAGMKAISRDDSAFGSQFATASMCSVPTVIPPSSWRNRFSSRIFME